MPAPSTSPPRGDGDAPGHFARRRLLSAAALLLLAAGGFAAGWAWGHGQWGPAPAPSMAWAPIPVAAAPAVPAAPPAGVDRPPAAAARVRGRRIVPPLDGATLSSRFGPRRDPFNGRPALHRGVDFAAARHASIVAAGPGVVTWSGPRAGYGNLVEIDHGSGWVTRYAHNAANLVSAGDYVRPGQAIALLGDTGRATGAHLHFELLYGGLHLDPARYLPPAT